jgi:thioredoxin 1
MREIMSDSIKPITEASFEAEVIKQSGLVLIDFWAPWCAPCRAMLPFLEQIAAEYEGRLMIKKVNVEDNAAMRETYNVMKIPTLILFKDGVECDRQRGWLNKTRLAGFLDPHVTGPVTVDGA